MELLAYTTKDNNNVIGKTLTLVNEYNIKFKNNSSIINPIIMLKSDTLLSFNYCYIPFFNRYYFVANVTVFPNNIFELELNVDVLESFKNDILSSYGFISRQNNYNSFYDSDYASEVKKEVDIYNSDTEININARNNILVTIGGV